MGCAVEGPYPNESVTNAKSVRAVCAMHDVRGDVRKIGYLDGRKVFGWPSTICWRGLDQGGGAGGGGCTGTKLVFVCACARRVGGCGRQRCGTVFLGE